MTQENTILRLGTRGSLLARTQSRLVADELEKLHPGLQVDLVITRTSGDVIAERPLHEFGGKGLFTKELEQALLDGRIDLAVHSFKDVPVTMPLVEQAGLAIAATTKREDPRDVLIAPQAKSLADLKPGARVGSSSLRRRCQVLAQRPDLVVEPVRGNIDTRLKKLGAGEFDAMLLAYAGLHRTGLYDADAMALVPLEAILPCPGQGALAIQCRGDDALTVSRVAGLDDPLTAACVAAERGVVTALEGDCHSPIAALASIDDAGMLHLRAAVGRRDGHPPLIRAAASAPAEGASDAVQAVHDALREQGVERLLRG